MEFLHGLLSLDLRQNFVEEHLLSFDESIRIPNTEFRNFGTIQNCFYQNNLLNNLIGCISYNICVPKPGFGKHEICDQKVTCWERQLLVNQELENLKYVIRRRKTTLAFLYAFMDIFCYFKDIISLSCSLYGFTNFHQFLNQSEAAVFQIQIRIRSSMQWSFPN